MLNIDCSCYTCQVCQVKYRERKKYQLLPPKIVESELWVMCFLSVDLVGPFMLKTPLEMHSLHTLTTIHPATGWFDIFKVNKFHLGLAL
jgi:hypothetical protein